MSTSFLGYCVVVQEANHFISYQGRNKKCHRKSEMTPFGIYHALGDEANVTIK